MWRIQFYYRICIVVICIVYQYLIFIYLFIYLFMGSVNPDSSACQNKLVSSRRKCCKLKIISPFFWVKIRPIEENKPKIIVFTLLYLISKNETCRR
jgi:hypothetical protein